MREASVGKGRGRVFVLAQVLDALGRQRPTEFSADDKTATHEKRLVHRDGLGAESETRCEYIQAHRSIGLVEEPKDAALDTIQPKLLISNFQFARFPEVLNRDAALVAAA